MLNTAPGQASVTDLQQQSSRTSPAASQALTISIDSISPQYATSNETVTVTGTLSNHTGSVVPGIAVQLQWYPSDFSTRSDMDSYANGGAVNVQGGTVIPETVGAPYPLSPTLADGATTRWRVSFNPAQSFASSFVTPVFGVYPLQVLAGSNSSGYQAIARSLLPYWPSASSDARRLRASWVWPLIGTPQQGACAQTLATSELAASLAANGRLATLLGAGAQGAAKGDLTWAIDPALLSDASVMTSPYFTGGNSACTGRTLHKEPSVVVAQWLSRLKTDTAGKPAFATPYANVDVAALSHAGFNASLRSAYRVGNEVAGKLLPSTFGPRDGASGGSAAGNSAALATAWPARGTADAGVLTSLAHDGGIHTVVLNSDELPSSTAPYDDALARTADGDGTRMSVLLADSEITGILGSASAGSAAAAQFAVTQDFLAQTAMICAEAPSISRSIVIAPPAGWDPSGGEAADLLALTKNAPWLRATGLGTLASDTASVSVQMLATRQVSKSELSDEYLDQIQSVTTRLGLYENLLAQPPADYLSSLDAATAATASTAWRGAGSPGGALALTKLADYLSNQDHRVQIIASSKILLAGASGTTPVSVQNGLSLAVQVRVVASAPPGSDLRVGAFDPVLKVEPGMTGTVRIPMTSSAAGGGTTTIELQLETRNGTPLSWTASPMSVEVTRFGRTLLIIIGGALGVLVLTAIVRLRRTRRAAGRDGDGADGDSADGNADSKAHAGGAG